MDKKRIADATNKLIELNATISKLDSSVRLSAFEILVPLYFDTDVPEGSTKRQSGKTRKSDLPRDAGEFYASHRQGKPADNVLLVVAWLYSQYGLLRITRELIESEANQAGLTIPNRPDNTIRYAKKGKKPLFKQNGNGWKLTTAGELYIKEQFQVTKGNLPIPEQVDE